VPTARSARVYALRAAVATLSGKGVSRGGRFTRDRGVRWHSWEGVRHLGVRSHMPSYVAKDHSYVLHPNDGSLRT
jgi:hypothetical protein